MGAQLCLFATHYFAAAAAAVFSCRCKMYTMLLSVVFSRMALS